MARISGFGLTVAGVAIGLVVGSPTAAPAGTLDQVLPRICKSAPLPPFDLSYLVNDSQGIVAFRPAEVARFLPQLPADQQFRLLLRCYLAMFMDINLDAAEVPRLSDLEQVVSNLSLQVTSPSDGKKGTFMLGMASPLSLRTVQPFDWADRLGKWLPQARHEHHAGRDYLTVPCKLTFGKPEPMRLAFFVADSRTLVCNGEDAMRELLQRLQDGKPGPTPPPGWEAVCRDLIAISIDARTQQWFKGTWPTQPVEMKLARTLVKGLTVFTMGVTLGQHPAVQVVATARNESTLGKIAANLEPLRAAIARELFAVEQSHPANPLAKSLITSLDHAAVEQEGPTLRIHVDLPADLIGLLVKSAQKSE
jgi:hypothetical protein